MERLRFLRQKTHAAQVERIGCSAGIALRTRKASRAANWQKRHIGMSLDGAVPARTRARKLIRNSVISQHHK